MVKPYRAERPGKLTPAHAAVYTNPRERAIRGDRWKPVIGRSCCRGGQEQRVEADGGVAPGRGHQHDHQLSGHPGRAADGGGPARSGRHSRARRRCRADHLARRTQVRRGFRRGPPVPRIGVCAGTVGRTMQAGQGRAAGRRRHRVASAGHASSRSATAGCALQHRARLRRRRGRSLARRGDSAGVPVGRCHGEHPDGCGASPRASRRFTTRHASPTSSTCARCSTRWAPRSPGRARRR